MTNEYLDMQISNIDEECKELAEEVANYKHCIDNIDLQLSSLDSRRSKLLLLRYPVASRADEA